MRRIQLGGFWVPPPHYLSLHCQSALLSSRHQQRRSQSEEAKHCFPAAKYTCVPYRYPYLTLTSAISSRYSACHLLPSFVQHGFPSTLPLAPPTRIPLVGFPSTPPVAPPSPQSPGHRPRRIPGAVYSAVPHPRATSPHHEPFGCFRDPPVPLPRIFCCSGPQRGLDYKRQAGVFRSPFGGSELPNVFDYASIYLCQVLNCPPGVGFFPPAIVPNITRPG